MGSVPVCMLGIVPVGQWVCGDCPHMFPTQPPKRSTACVEDGSITTSFLSLFGRPARDTGLPDERGSDVNAMQRREKTQTEQGHQ